jgi:hypothetical protein
MDIFNMGAPTQDVSSVELVFCMAVNYLIWRRRCQALHLESPLHEDAYESFLKIELEQAVNMASTKIYDIQLFFDEWLYLDLFDLTTSTRIDDIHSATPRISRISSSGAFNAGPFS